MHHDGVLEIRTPLPLRLREIIRCLVFAAVLLGVLVVALYAYVLSNAGVWAAQASARPSQAPTPWPSASPTWTPSESPTWTPTRIPTWTPSKSPTKRPSESPSKSPTRAPSESPTTERR